MFAVLEWTDFFWIFIIVVGATGSAAASVRLIRRQLQLLEVRLRRLEEKADLLLKYTNVSEGDKELLREINKLRESPG